MKTYHKIIIDVDKGDKQSNDEIIDMFVTICAYMDLIHSVKRDLQSLSTSQSEGTELSSSGSPDGSPKVCPHCNMDMSIRNPSGYCDHLYYPEYCEVCKKREGNPSDD